MPVDSLDRRKFIQVVIGAGCALAIPVNALGKPHDFCKAVGKDGKKPVCVWHLGDPCEGVVWDAPIFERQILVPMCSNHLTGHRIIISLHKAGHDVEDILVMSPEGREALASNLVLVGWDEI